MTNEASDSGGLPSLEEVVERIGFGPYQILACCIGGAVFFVGGAQCLLVSSLTSAISSDLGLNHWERGAIVSFVFIGVFLGNSLGGPLGDAWGRRGPIILSHLCVLLVGLLCSIAQHHWVLCGLRLCLGVAMGLATCPWLVLCTEITPVFWRIPMNAFSQSLFTMGELYSGATLWWSDSSMRHLDWRWLTVMGTFPPLLFTAMTYPFLLQSPSYLAVQGRDDEAREVLRSMARGNGAPQATCRFRPERAPPAAAGTWEGMRRKLQSIFGGPMLGTTLIVTYTCFVLNLIFFGTLHAFPQVVAGVDMGRTPAASLLVGALWEMPGLAMAAIFGVWFRRVPVMLFCLATTSLSLVAFTVGATLEKTAFTDYLIHGGFAGVKIFVGIGFVVIYQYAAEVYPVVCRSTGNAICLSGGRLGAILAPTVFEVMSHHTGGFDVFFHAIAALAVVNMGLLLLLPSEVDAAKRIQTGESQPIKQAEPRAIA